MASSETNVRMIRGKCPICKKPTEHAYRPFCSSRCADVDLARWLGGTYAIAGSEDSDEDGETTAAESARQGAERARTSDGEP